MKAIRLVIWWLLFLTTLLPAQETRTLKVDDMFLLKNVGEPQISPDGKWIAYTVSAMDAKEDNSDTDIYMCPIGGGESIRLTGSKRPETNPRWSPDGRYLAFLSGREGTRTQVWLLSRAGGEAVRLTDYKAGVSSLAWSPDGKRLALVVGDADPEQSGAEGDEARPKTAKPLVIQRLQFKQDGAGYLRDSRRHIYIFDVEKKSSEQITSGPYDDSPPVWSPDGKWLAFSSNRTPEPDSNFNSDIFVVEATSGRIPLRLTTSEGSDGAPAFSPDGMLIAYVAGGNPKDIWYAIGNVAVVPIAGGPARILTSGLDRNVSNPRFTSDGRSVLFLLEDGGNSHLARISIEGGQIARVVGGERDVRGYAIGKNGEVAVLESTVSRPAEISVEADGFLRRITTVNDDFLKGIRLATVERFKAKSLDGTLIDGFLTRPPGARGPGRLPTVLRIHGGPVSQFTTGFNLEWQLFAAHGFAVVAANPRGSSGYGQAFSRAIYADWGNKDFQDVMAAVDHAVAMGVADPDRLGVGGWSYGGILTNYVITKTTRFKAAISGASEVNFLADYGTDHYQRQWEAELGLPWKSTDLWIRMSPFFKVENIVTPTLVMCGQDDMNVPLLNSEQLYQALRRLGRETELVIYPGQSHGIRTPSYQKDRYERYLAWYGRYLKVPVPSVTAGQKPEATSLLGVSLYSPKPAGAAGKQIEENLAKATEDFVKDPDGADNIVWLGRRLAYAGRFRDAIDVYTRGVEKYPRDFRLLRHRAHRYITVREFVKAVADLDKATELIRGVPDEVEPPGAPTALGAPPSTSHFNIWYHLGLAYYLKGDFENALRSYRECMKFSNDDDRLVATSDWLYMTLRRLNRNGEAAKVLEPIHKGLKVVENTAYRDRLLMYKGEKTPEELLGNQGDSTALATYGYGVGNWYLYHGQTARAKEIFEKVVRGAGWPAFGFIAAEADLARIK